MKTENTIQAANLAVENYLKEKKELFRIERVKDTFQKYSENQQNNLRNGLTLGRLIAEGLSEFSSPEAKQLRKEMNLPKMNNAYFLREAYGLCDKWCYKLKAAYELGTEIHNEYINTGTTDKDLSISGLISFARPEKPKKEESTEESTEETTEETTEESTTKTIKIGAITINIGEASTEDILKAIEYLQNLAK